MASKLKQLSTTEIAHKMLIVEGIMAIQAGVSPRVVEELLKSHVPPSERDEPVPAVSEAPPAAAAEAA
jgi:chemotaxis protein MotA